MENIVRKGEIACNKQFLLFSQCFLPYMALIFHFKPIIIQCSILKHQRYIAMENIVRKGEIACNKQFLLFSQCFLPHMALIFRFKCRLQFVSIWTSLKFCSLVMDYTENLTTVRRQILGGLNLSEFADNNFRCG